MQLLNSSWSAKNLLAQVGDFPGGPVAKFLRALNAGDWVSFLVGELDPQAATERWHVAAKIESVCCSEDSAQPNKYIK